MIANQISLHGMLYGACTGSIATEATGQLPAIFFDILRQLFFLAVARENMRGFIRSTEGMVKACLSIAMGICTFRPVNHLTSN